MVSMVRLREAVAGGQSRKDLEPECWYRVLGPPPTLPPICPSSSFVLTCWPLPRSRPRWSSWGRGLAGGLRTPKLEADAEMSHGRAGLVGGSSLGDGPHPGTPPGVPAATPPTAPPQHRPCWKLTHDPHHDVTQDEEKEEDAADDVCAAPGREVGEAFGGGGRACALVGSRVGAGEAGEWVSVGFILFF